MIVIGDTCTINYLLRANIYEDVYKYFGGLIVPEKVKKELEGTPAILELQMVVYPLKVLKPESIEDIHLDPGETEAIALYKQIGADMFLTDDFNAYKYCKSNNINVKRFIEVVEIVKDKIDMKKLKTTISKSSRYMFTDEIRSTFYSEV